ncbi:MAG: hypothetical protein Q4G19_07055 [Clostridia bacterium]|nr:hypothetical protein [Clostridia bacterium]
MFCVRIADVVIGIDHRYECIREFCRDYLAENADPAFTVSVSNAEIMDQIRASDCSRGYAESLCIFRKICLRLVRYDAFLMHCAVVAVDGTAYAFAAPSGTGKTTHICLWRELLGDRVTVVNGDKPVLRFAGERLMAFGTPWQGKENYGSNVSYPLGGICFLEQGTENAIRKTDMQEVLPRAFRQLLLPKDGETMDLFLDLAERMLKTVPCYVMRCTISTEAAELAYRTMKEGLTG